MVEHRRTTALLRGTTNLAAIGGDVIDGDIPRIDAELRECSDDPAVEEFVGFDVAKASDQLLWHIERVGDAVAALHEHRTAAGKTTHHLYVVLLYALGFEFVDVGLVGADDGGTVFPIPEPQSWTTLTRIDLVKEDFVEGNIHHRWQDTRLQNLPLQIGEVDSLSQCAANDLGNDVCIKAVQSHLAAGLILKILQRRIEASL